MSKNKKKVTWSDPLVSTRIFTLDNNNTRFVNRELRNAILSGNVNAAKNLLSIGGDPNNAINYHRGLKPLHVAASSGNTRMVKLLLNHGADPKMQNMQGRTPFDIAVLKGHATVVEELLKQGGASVNSRDYLGTTPLHFAASQGHANVVRKLLNHGAKVNSKSDVGQTPLFIASRKGHANVVRLLLKRGANPKIVVQNMLLGNTTPKKVAKNKRTRNMFKKPSRKPSRK